MKSLFPPLRRAVLAAAICGIAIRAGICVDSTDVKTDDRGFMQQGVRDPSPGTDADDADGNEGRRMLLTADSLWEKAKVKAADGKKEEALAAYRHADETYGLIQKFYPLWEVQTVLDRRARVKAAMGHLANGEPMDDAGPDGGVKITSKREKPGILSNPKMGGNGPEANTASWVPGLGENRVDNTWIEWNEKFNAATLRVWKKIYWSPMLWTDAITRLCALVLMAMALLYYWLRPARKWMCWLRYWAQMADVVVLWPVSTVIFLVRDHCDSWSAKVTLDGVYVLLVWCYFVGMISRSGMTLGKMLFAVKVVDVRTGGSVPVGRAALRETLLAVPALTLLMARALIMWAVGNDKVEAAPLLRFMWEARIWIFFGWLLVDIGTMFFNAEGRTLHDYLAGTKVVKTRGETATEEEKEDGEAGRDEAEAYDY